LCLHNNGVVNFKSVHSFSRPRDTSSTTYLTKYKYYLPEIRAVHLDLKGAAPNLSYMKEVFSLIKESGGNALIVEYEDMFPYWGPMANASALNAFTIEEIQEVLCLLF